MSEMNEALVEKVAERMRIETHRFHAARGYRRDGIPAGEYSLEPWDTVAEYHRELYRARARVALSMIGDELLAMISEQLRHNWHTGMYRGWECVSIPLLQEELAKVAGIDLEMAPGGRDEAQCRWCTKRLSHCMCTSPDKDQR